MKQNNDFLQNATERQIKKKPLKRNRSANLNEVEIKELNEKNNLN